VGRRTGQKETGMKMSLCAALFAAAMTLAAGAASVDPGKDESGKGRWRGDYVWGESERKSKFFTRDGCEVERKWKKGEYESKVKCKPGRYGYGY
jgi:opacity protein-like surface antigen